MELGYWKVKGILEPVRYLLHLLQIDYQERHPANYKEYLDISEQAKFDFPNMPYLIDGAFKLTESSAIPLYIVIKANRDELYGHQGPDRSTHQMLLGIYEDIIKCMCDIYFAANYLEAYDKMIQWLDTKFHNLSLFLDGRTFLLGYCTYADLKLIHVIDMLQILQRSLGKSDILAQYENLLVLKQRVKNLPGIKEYLTTNPSAAYPLFPADRVRFPLQHIG